MILRQGPPSLRSAFTTSTSAISAYPGLSPSLQANARCGGPSCSTHQNFDGVLSARIWGLHMPSFFAAQATSSGATTPCHYTEALFQQPPPPPPSITADATSCRGTAGNDLSMEEGGAATWENGAAAGGKCGVVLLCSR